MVTVTPAELTDVPGIVALLEELERFYGTTEFPSIAQREADVRAALFGPGAPMVWLARDSGGVVGLASCSYLWPAAGVSRSLFLKELYVGESVRRGGVGRELMRAVFAAAVAAGCSRVEWQTELGNTVARDFYAALGAQVLDGKIAFRVDGDLLAALAG